jgi:hypothetical protein
MADIRPVAVCRYTSISPYAHIQTYNEAAMALIPLKEYEVGYTSDKQKFSTAETRKTVAIDHGITTRRTGVELL